MHIQGARLVRWIGGVLLVVLVAGTVYRPHLLQGEPTPPVFPPRRIVSLNLAADEVLLALTPPERIAALTYLADNPTYSNVRAEARAIPHKVKANAEQVLALQPDLIIVSAHTSADVKGLLQTTGVSLLELQQFTSLADVEANILAIGQATGAADKARTLVAMMEQRFQEVRQHVANVPWPRVLYYSAGGFVSGKGTTMDEMIAYAGGRNVALEASVQQVKKMSQEKLVALNPAVILVSGEDDQAGLRKLLLADPVLQEVEAIRTGRVHNIPRAYTSTVSQYVVKGVEAIARILHPGVFPAREERP
ncbi:MAG: ABC transporter substrate-binding protein [Deltaproteobacteria bacterium]|nr:ABC transporter substrate-binding protein [Deltaproteobacteria bacterium]